MEAKSNQPNPSGSDTSNAPPPIAEKVRFWQEQDRINKAMIPRILKLAEDVGRLQSRVDGFQLGEKTATWKYVEAVDQRVQALGNRLQMLDARLDKTPDVKRLQGLVWFAAGAAILAVLGVAYLVLQTVG